MEYAAKIGLLCDMKNVAFVTDRKTKDRYAKISLKKVAKISDEELEDLMDVIVAEARKNDEKISINELEKLLIKDGKL
jgi:hypothetical protein